MVVAGAIGWNGSVASLWHVACLPWQGGADIFLRAEAGRIGGFLKKGSELSELVRVSLVSEPPLVSEPLIACLRQELRTDKVVHADETPVQMLAPGNGKTKTAYLFAYRLGEIEEPPIIVYDYVETRSGKHVRSFLEGYGGAPVVDDYVGYKAFFETGQVREIACWAHARRKFFELHEANQSALAAEALARIADLYAIEA